MLFRSKITETELVVVLKEIHLQKDVKVLRQMVGKLQYELVHMQKIRKDFLLQLLDGE